MTVRGLRRACTWLLRGVVIGVLLSIVSVLVLRWANPWTTAFMLESPYESHYAWVDLEDISPQAAMAVIASEDQLFPFHAGFDVKSIRQAIRHNANSKKVRGASTISQQVAKNLYLWPSRSYFRKGLEVWFTVLIEIFWPKERILEMYLNIAEFGPGIYGVQAAAQRFYHKNAARLSRRESATLAAVLPNPRALRVAAPSAYVLKRRDHIIGQMRALGGEAYLKTLDDDAPGAAQPRS